MADLNDMFLDSNSTVGKSQPLLKMEVIHQEAEESEMRKKARLLELMTVMQKQFPQQSPMANYMRAHGLLQQEGIRETEFAKGLRNAQQKTGMTY